LPRKTYRGWRHLSRARSRNVAHARRIDLQLHDRQFAALLTLFPNGRERGSAFDGLGCAQPILDQRVDPGPTRRRTKWDRGASTPEFLESVGRELRIPHFYSAATASALSLYGNREMVEWLTL
jgi:hypothetical protein